MLARALLLSASLAFALGGAAVAGPKGGSSSGGGASNNGSSGSSGSSNAGGSGNAGSNSSSSSNSGGGNAGGNSGSNASSGNSGSSSGGGSTSGAGGSTPVVQATLPLCKLSDLSSPASACSGFFQGNLLSQSPADLAAQSEGLAAIGLANWDGQIAEPQLDLSTTQVDFTTLLRGVSFIGIHWGAGANSPSPLTSGGVTAFYALDAGDGLDAFSLAFGSASGARLYLTQPAPARPEPPLLPPSIDTPPPIETPAAFEEVRAAIPEPATWALMILGFGAVGAMLRRRRGAEAAA